MIDLSQFDNSWYAPGRSRLVQALWFLFGAPLLRSRNLPWSGMRTALLRLFGARIAPGVVIKPGVRVKYPWLLSVGAQTWIGEEAWIDNLSPVTLAANVCISQGAYLCTGNHDWSDPAFGLIVEPIAFEEGAWAGARSLIGPGVTLHRGAVAVAGSVVTKDIPAFEIHAGNPARFIRIRRICDEISADQPVLCA
jgi:putative colanic acid biosynthesis acetyltransferase WcaF